MSRVMFNVGDKGEAEIQDDRQVSVLHTRPYGGTILRKGTQLAKRNKSIFQMRARLVGSEPGGHLGRMLTVPWGDLLLEVIYLVEPRALVACQRPIILPVREKELMRD